MPIHVLSHVPFPGLEEHVEIALPGTLLTLVGEEPSGGEENYDCLLTAAVGVSGLAETLQRYPSIRWVHVFGTGMDNFPLHEVGDRLLTCSRGASAVPISEWVLAMMLGFEKQLPTVWVNEPPEVWHQTFQLSSLAGKQLSILGFGGIGRAIAQRALAFEMSVKALTRSSQPDMDGVETATGINELAAGADHLVLAAPATAATQNIINAEVLSLMKPTAHIVNIARGSLVDTDALKQALDNEQIACASLDTVLPEPLPAGHWLYSHPRVRLSPHVSWSDASAFTQLLDGFLQNLHRYGNDQVLQGIVNIEEGY